MEGMRDFLATEIGGISVRALGVSLAIIAAGFVVARVIEVLFTRLERQIPELTVRRAVIGALHAPVGWLVRVAAIWAALEQMPIDRIEVFDTQRLLDSLLLAVTIVLATWLGVRIVDRLCKFWEQRAKSTEGTFDDQLVPITRKTAKVFLILTGSVMVAQNLGYSVTSLIAGLGLGGAALAFASKDTVANFFGSIVVFVDRPFQVGDWIEVGSVEGTVETVGLRVTRIRTFANSLITIPNATFTTTAINNWSRMKKRRIKMTIRLTYDTPPGKMREAVQAIRDIIENDDRLHQDFYLVNFHEFSSSSLDIFCYLFTRTTNWAEHMQVREEFMLKIMDAMANLGLSFAFPTQTVHLEGSSTEPPANRPIPAAPKAMLRETPL